MHTSLFITRLCTTENHVGRWLSGKVCVLARQRSRVRFPVPANVFNTKSDLSVSNSAWTGQMKKLKNWQKSNKEPLLCPWARHLTLIAPSFGWDVKPRSPSRAAYTTSRATHNILHPPLIVLLSSRPLFLTDNARLSRCNGGSGPRQLRVTHICL